MPASAIAPTAEISVAFRSLDLSMLISPEPDYLPTIPTTTISHSKSRIVKLNMTASVTLRHPRSAAFPDWQANAGLRLQHAERDEYTGGGRHLPVAGDFDERT